MATHCFPDFSEQGYQIERELGQNRVGGRVTYLAQSHQLQQAVVIKQFQFAKGSFRWADYDAYQREIQVMQGLAHPGIPRYLDSFQTEDGFCMVQEYKQAQSLGVPRSFHFNEIQKIAIALLKILVYLQSRVPAVIHRDIKPENILVDEQINVFLVDFGFAHIGDGEVGISSVVKGTLGFMPPEQLFNRQLTEASDLYGVGVTLICLLTGIKSVDVGNLIDITYRVNFRHLVAKLSVGWMNWLEKMVEPRVKDRFPSAAAALDAIPAHEMRPPEAQFSQTELQFVATRSRELLTQSIAVTNPVPETVLEGRWEVAPHPSYPPHTPDSHAWISFQTMSFTGNRATNEIRVDTSKLIPGKVYSRRLLLQTNAFPQTYGVTVTVRTVPIAQGVAQKTMGGLALLFGFSLVVAWLLTQLAVVFGAIAADNIANSFGYAIGAMFGFELAAWGLMTAGARAGGSCVRCRWVGGVFSGPGVGLVGGRFDPQWDFGGHDGVGVGCRGDRGRGDGPYRRVFGGAGGGGGKYHAPGFAGLGVCKLSGVGAGVGIFPPGVNGGVGRGDGSLDWGDRSYRIAPPPGGQ